MLNIAIDGVIYEAVSGERLIDVINRAHVKLSQVCYHPQLGPIQTCDTCMVEINGQLARACATTVSAGIAVSTKSEKAGAAQREAFDRILTNHVLYCTQVPLSMPRSFARTGETSTKTSGVFSRIPALR